MLQLSVFIAAQAGCNQLQLKANLGLVELWAMTRRVMTKQRIDLKMNM
jgi:hypothetical protein